MKQSLLNKGVVITRPKAQAVSLAKQIRSYGGRPILFPTLEIHPLEESSAITESIQSLDKIDIAVFVSVNAVNFASKWIKRAWSHLPPQLQIAAIGSATCDQLTTLGWPASIYPKNTYNSEALLQHPQLEQVNGKNIVIFSGEGGREYLQKMLIERGANVNKVGLYQRRCPRVSVDPLLTYWKNDEIDIILSTSGESLENLCKLLGEQGMAYLRQTPLLVISERMAKTAQQLGYQAQPIITNNANETAIMQSLLAWSTGDRT